MTSVPASVFSQGTLPATHTGYGRRDLVDPDFLLSCLPGVLILYQIKPQETDVLYCSEGVKKLFGWEPEEFCRIVAEEPDILLHPADVTRFHRVLEQSVSDHSDMSAFYRGHRKDGAPCWIWFRGHLIGEKDGCPLMEAVLLDITMNADMYTGILDEVTAMITIIDCETYEVLYGNRSAIDVTKDKPGEYVGSVCYRYIAGLDVPCPHCLMRRAIPQDYDSREVSYGGRVYSQLFKIIQWNGRRALLEYGEDITDQKQNLLYAEERKNALNRIVNYIPAGILVFRVESDSFSVAEANPAVCDMMGIRAQDVIGVSNQDVLSLIHPNDLPLVWDMIAKLRVAGQEVQYKYRNFNPNRHQYIWLSAHGRSVAQPDGRTLVYVSYEDITQQQKMQELQNRLTAAEQSATAKAEFYSRMSHDMRTPMNGILGLSALAAQETDVTQLHQDIAKIAQSGRYMLSLINDTLDLQRIETGRMKLEPQIFTGQEFLDDTLTMIRPGVLEKGLTLSVVPGTLDLNRPIRADLLRLKQIGVNLFSNAIKFTPAGGRIELRMSLLERKDTVSRVRFLISDTGVGMSAEFLEHGIFQPFSQEQNAMTLNYTGSGLGLSIVKNLVEMMGGTIQVESELGTGTTFQIDLNFEIISQEEASRLLARHSTGSAQAVQSLFGKNILLCEDHPLNAEITRRLLEQANCHVKWAKNGVECTEFFRSAEMGYFDAILMDIRMPMMDGLTAARTIRRLPRPDAATIPILAMSANAYAEDIRKSLDAGMNAHLAKPVEPEQLYQTLAAQIAARKDAP